jgi:hypothetical protein
LKTPQDCRPIPDFYDSEISYYKNILPVVGQILGVEQSEQYLQDFEKEKKRIQTSIVDPKNWTS